MKVQCPRCKTKLEVDPAANKDKCPVCGYEFPIPHKAPRSVPISEAVSTPLSPGKSKSKNPVFLIGGAAVLVLGLVSSGVTWWILRSPAKVASAPLAVPQDAPKPAAQPLASIPASTPREDKTSQEIARLRAEEDKTSQEIARLRAENDRLRALTSPAVKPTPSPQAIEPLYGKVSGAAWSVKNDGTSNLLRGIPIVIV
jgi:cytoskeletal protein RodZ